MQPIVMMDWNTIRGNGVTVIQNASQWVNTGPFEDVFFSIDVREITGAPGTTISIETAPTRDDVLFQPMVAAFAPGVGMNFKSVIASVVTTAVPVSQWSRWKIVLPVGGTNDITLRIIMHGNRFC